MGLRKKRGNRRFERRKVLEVKLRSSQRRRVWIRRMAVLLVLTVVLGGGGYGGWHGLQQLWLELVERNPYFSMEHLDIQTDGVISPAQVQRWAGVEKGRNLYGVRLDRVKRDLELVPAIRTASVERVLPNTLRIRITERDTVARMMHPVVNRPGEYQMILVDEEGFAMLPLESHQVIEGAARRYEHLPILTGVPTDRVRPGWPIVSERVSSALQLIRAFEASPLAGLMHVAAVDVSVPGSIQMRTENGCEVNFGLTDFERQLRRWWAVLHHARQEGRELAWLDLSVSNNVPVRWRERSSQLTETDRGKENV
jgi:cell division protein FtsQ